MTDAPVTFPENSVWWYMPDDLAGAYSDELKKEVGPQHPLFHSLNDLIAIAKCDANDDVLVANVVDGSCFYLVHLTWSGKHDQMPNRYPGSTMIKLADLQEFFARY